MLARFLAGEEPVISSLKSSQFQIDSIENYWFARAELSNKFQNASLQQKNGIIHGAAWAKNKAHCQEKAITEAIERLAFLEYQANKFEAGLDLDPSTTGFAALPVSFSLTELRQAALAESLERWVLNEIYYSQSLQIKQISDSERERIYHAEVSFEDTNYHFVLCLLKNNNTGFAPGSACSTTKKSALQSAKLEAYNNYRKAGRILANIEEHNKLNLLETRLLNYFQNSDIAKKYVDKLSKCTINKPREPEIIFENRLEGIWNPEINIYRVILSYSESIVFGGEEKMMI